MASGRRAYNMGSEHSPFWNFLVSRSINIPGSGVTNTHRMLARPKRREYRPAVGGKGLAYRKE